MYYTCSLVNWNIVWNDVRYSYWFLVYMINDKMVYNSFITEKNSCKVSKQFNCKMEVYKMKNVNNNWVTEN